LVNSKYNLEGDCCNPANYRPISLTAVCSKIMEHILYHSIIEHLNLHHILKDHQFGFRSDYSCETQLITVVEDILAAVDQRHQVTSSYWILVKL